MKGGRAIYGKPNNESSLTSPDFGFKMWQESSKRDQTMARQVQLIYHSFGHCKTPNNVWPTLTNLVFFENIETNTKKNGINTWRHVIVNRKKMMFEIFKISGPWLSIVGTKKINGRVLVYDHAEPNEYTSPSSQGSYYLQKNW